VIVRYALFQVPVWVLLVLVLIIVRWWVHIPAWLVWVIFALWITKDVILFPFVWRAYDQDPSRSLNTLIGKQGIAMDRLSPSGYVKVHGELWQAEVIGGSPTIERGERVKVQGIRGLTLLVQPDHE